MSKRNKTNDVGNGNNFQENPPAGRITKQSDKHVKMHEQKKAETEKALFFDLSDLDGLMYDDMAEKLYKLGWRNKDIDEKYNFLDIIVLNVFALLACFAVLAMFVREILPFFGIVI